MDVLQFMCQSIEYTLYYKIKMKCIYYKNKTLYSCEKKCLPCHKINGILYTFNHNPKRLLTTKNNPNVNHQKTIK